MPPPSQSDSEPDVPHLTESWHNARKSYGLFAGLLIAWALIGLEVTEAPLDNVNVKLLTPDAIPLVLVVMVLYFAGRASIEWHQCDQRRRVMLASRMDCYLAHGVAGSALAVYFGQRLSGVQLADFFLNRDSTRNVFAAAFGFTFTSVAFICCFHFRGRRTMRGSPVRPGMFAGIVCFCGFYLSMMLMSKQPWTSTVWWYIGAGVGLNFAAVLASVALLKKWPDAVRLLADSTIRLDRLPGPNELPNDSKGAGS